MDGDMLIPDFDNPTFKKPQNPAEFESLLPTTLEETKSMAICFARSLYVGNLTHNDIMIHNSIMLLYHLRYRDLKYSDPTYSDDYTTLYEAYFPEYSLFKDKSGDDGETVDDSIPLCTTKQVELGLPLKEVDSKQVEIELPLGKVNSKDDTSVVEAIEDKLLPNKHVAAVESKLPHDPTPIDDDVAPRFGLLTEEERIHELDVLDKMELQLKACDADPIQYADETFRHENRNLDLVQDTIEAIHHKDHRTRSGLVQGEQRSEPKGGRTSEDRNREVSFKNMDNVKIKELRLAVFAQRQNIILGGRKSIQVEKILSFLKNRQVMNTGLHYDKASKLMMAYDKRIQFYGPLASTPIGENGIIKQPDKLESLALANICKEYATDKTIMVYDSSHSRVVDLHSEGSLA